MDALDAWFDTVSSTPIGAILMFLAVFLMRVSIDDIRRKRDRRDDEPKRRRIV